MGLRLRRGTNANRLLFIPVEGELLYVTDHTTANVSALWVGDGITLGGVPVDTDTDLNTQLDLATQSIANLGDVNVGVDSTVAENGDFLGYVEASGDWNPMKPTVGGAGDVNASGILDGEVLTWNFVGQDFRNTAMALNLLADVDITSTPPTAGQVLKWDSVDSKFKPQDDTDTTLVLSGLSIGDLGDVNLQADGSTQPEHGDVIVFDSVSNTFVLGKNNSSINQLSDVNLDGINQFDYLVWTGTRFDAFANPLLTAGAIQKDTEGTHTGAVEGTTVNASVGFAGNLQGDADGDHTGTFTGPITATGTLNGTLTGTVVGAITATGTLDGDLTGSVFGDDSGILVDGVNSKIVGPVVGAINTGETINVTLDQTLDGNDGFVINMHRGTDAVKLEPNNFDRSFIKWASWNGSAFADNAVIGGYHKAGGGGYLAITPTEADGTLFTTAIELDGVDGTIAINTTDKVTSNAPIESTKYLRVGSYATGALPGTAAGTIAFDSTTNTFKGYNGTSWVELG